MKWFKPEPEPVYTGRWRAIYRCADCKKGLRGWDVSNQDGVCPYCGTISKTGTVNHEIGAMRHRRETPGGPIVTEFKDWVR